MATIIDEELSLFTLYEMIQNTTSGVSKLNNLTGDITLQAGDNITLGVFNNTITINSSATIDSVNTVTTTTGQTISNSNIGTSNLPFVNSYSENLYVSTITGVRDESQDNDVKLMINCNDSDLKVQNTQDIFFNLYGGLKLRHISATTPTVTYDSFPIQCNNGLSLYAGEQVQGDYTGNINMYCACIVPHNTSLGYSESGEKVAFEKAYINHINCPKIMSYTSADEADLELISHDNTYFELYSGVNKLAISYLNNSLSIVNNIGYPRTNINVNSNCLMLTNYQQDTSNPPLDKYEPLLIRSNEKSDLILNAPGAGVNCVCILAGDMFDDADVDVDNDYNGAYIQLRGGRNIAEEENNWGSQIILNSSVLYLGNSGTSIRINGNGVAYRGFTFTGSVSLQNTTTFNDLQANNDTKTINVNNTDITCSTYAPITGYGTCSDIVVALSTSDAQFKQRAKYIINNNENAREIIQQAINDCPVGGTVFIAPGTYNLAPDTYGPITIDKTIRILGGTGFNTVLKDGNNDGSNDGIFLITHTGVVIENLMLSNEDGINILTPYITLGQDIDGKKSASDLVIKNVFFAPKANTSTLIKCSLNSICEYVRIDNCRFYLAQAGTCKTVDAADTASFNMLVSNSINSSGDAYINFVSGAGRTNNFVLGPSFGNIRVVENL